MSAAEITAFFSQALYLALWLSLPPIVVASVVGTLFALVQALTQIQEQTLSFGVKLVAVTFTLFLTARWMGGELYNFTVQILDALPRLAR